MNKRAFCFALARPCAPSLQDVDDALSFEFDLDPDAANCGPGGGGHSLGRAAAKKVVRLGVHIADVASRVPCGSPLYAWARERISSAYHGGVLGADDGEGGEEKDGEVAANARARRRGAPVQVSVGRRSMET